MILGSPSCPSSLAPVVKTSPSSGGSISRGHDEGEFLQRVTRAPPTDVKVGPPTCEEDTVEGAAGDMHHILPGQ